VEIHCPPTNDRRIVGTHRHTTIHKEEPRTAPYVGTAVLSPRQTAWITLQLTPGHYALVCPLPDAKGRPHFLMGMLSIVAVR
jgi:hypothetical protein